MKTLSWFFFFFPQNLHVSALIVAFTVKSNSYGKSSLTQKVSHFEFAAFGVWFGRGRVCHTEHLLFLDCSGRRCPLYTELLCHLHWKIICPSEAVFVSGLSPLPFCVPSCRHRDTWWSWLLSVELSAIQHCSFKHYLDDFEAFACKCCHFPQKQPAGICGLNPTADLARTGTFIWSFDWYM